MNIPQALGYTKIAGMPVVTGFYTLLLPLLAFAVFVRRVTWWSEPIRRPPPFLPGSWGMAPVASARYVALATTIALITAGFLLLARVLNSASWPNFLSQTVLIGFLTGVGFQVGIAVLGQMVGLEVHSKRTVGQLFEVFRSLHQVQLPSVAISLIVVAGVFVFHRFAPKVPGPLIAVAGAIAASAAWDFAGRGIASSGRSLAGFRI